LLPYFPQIVLDTEAGAAYIYLEKGASQETRQLTDTINADYDRGRAVGYEFLAVKIPANLT
jgi:uncharacterized protein YuzE